ncbi:hypothetical protein N4S67_11415 [Mycobacterium sp. CPCC 205710]|uniref:Transmembrane protein n=1 Tax=Mycobacterium deserti TaxID=2978347 RepID=A0ABT2M9U7_9MYCO|nr:hypothetical protein [Mycobacterium deserti]MCT7659030.1 hypothetical protein [Mycobacterium deserti]
MHAASAVAVAVIFVWVGMVVAISFLEAPLKFRAPGVTLQIGLGIGRLVFRALNASESALAAVLMASFAVEPPSTSTGIAAGAAVVTLLAQLFVVRPSLARRSEVTLAGGEAPRSPAHWVYVGLEVVKLVALLVTGVLLLGT